MKNNHLHNILKSCLLVLLFIGLTTCSRNPVTGKRELMFMSEKQEIAMGANADPSITASYGVYNDDKLQNFINQKGKQMGAISHRPNLTYSFKILDSPVVNAFALPGGYVYFTRGIMAHFNNEAEFAGVLGHEIGHVTARHSASQQSKSTLAQIGLIAGMIASPTFAQYGQQAMQGMQLMFLKFGRDDESQSDKLGVEYSTKIGYNAHEMADFFKTLDKLRGGDGQELPDFSSTHPDPINRFKKVHQEADKWQEGKNTNSLKVNRDSYLRMIDGLMYGEDPQQGYVENNVFYHPELKWQYPVPTNWQVLNSPTQVQMAPKNGKAMMVLTLAQEKTLDEASNNFITNNKLNVINSKNEQIHGNAAKVVLADQVDPNNPENVVRILTYFIQYNTLIYMMHGMAAKKDYNAFTSHFERTMKGFKKLTDASKINVKAERIKIEKVRNNATLSAALKSFGMKSDRLKELAILNGMELSEQVKAGMLIKTIAK